MQCCLEAHYFLGQEAPKMVVPSSSAKKVVRKKADAVKRTQSSPRKYVPWVDRYTKLVVFKEKQGRCHPHYSTELGSGVTISANASRPNHIVKIRLIS